MCLVGDPFGFQGLRGPYVTHQVIFVPNSETPALLSSLQMFLLQEDVKYIKIFLVLVANSVGKLHGNSRKVIHSLSSEKSLQQIKGVRVASWTVNVSEQLLFSENGPRAGSLCPPRRQEEGVEACASVPSLGQESSESVPGTLRFNLDVQAPQSPVSFPWGLSAQRPQTSSALSELSKR